MSWLFSQALVAAYSAATCSDGEPSVQLNGNPTQLAYLPPDKMTAFSRLSRFGMTFALLTADRGAELLTLYLAAFPAKTSAAQARGPGSTESAQVSGEKWQGSLARYDRNSRLWKTHQYSLLGGLTEFSETWPRWGLMRNGELFPQQTLVPPTGETESGLLPTPLASLGTNGGPNQRDSSGRPGLQMAAMMWPTPTCGMASHSQLSAESSQRELIRSLRDRGGPSTLAIAVQAKWPTPTTSEAKSDTLNIQNRINKGKQIMLYHAVRMNPTPEKETPQAGGSLNPMWVEWLMGWPLGWSDLRPLEMGKFRSWQQQRLICSSKEEN